MLDSLAFDFEEIFDILLLENFIHLEFFFFKKGE